MAIRFEKFFATRQSVLRIIVYGVLSAVIARQANAGDVVRGQQLYQTRCTVCHALDGNREGPAHRGVFGRKAGSVANFDYSPALKTSQVVWNEKTLDLWLSNPELFIPGQKMDFSISSADERADIISYLHTLSVH